MKYSYYFSTCTTLKITPCLSKPQKANLLSAVQTLASTVMQNQHKINIELTKLIYYFSVMIMITHALYERVAHSSMTMQHSTKRGFTRCGEITKQLGNRCFSTVAVERDCLSNELRIRSPLGLLPDQIYIKQKEKKKVRRIIDKVLLGNETNSNKRFRFKEKEGVTQVVRKRIKKRRDH